MRRYLVLVASRVVSCRVAGDLFCGLRNKVVAMAACAFTDSTVHCILVLIPAITTYLGT